MSMEITPDHIQDGSTGQGEEQGQLHHWEATARLLRGGLRILALVELRVGELDGATVGDLDGPTLQRGAGADALLSSLAGGQADLAHPILGQAVAGLDVSGGALIDWFAAGQAAKSLHLADDFSTGGAWIEHLPDKALQAQTQGVIALATVGALIFADQQRVGDHPAQVLA